MTSCDAWWRPVTLDDVLWRLMTSCDAWWRPVTFDDVLWRLMASCDAWWHPVTFDDVLCAWWLGWRIEDDKRRCHPSQQIPPFGLLKPNAFMIHTRHRQYEHQKSCKRMSRSRKAKCQAAAFTRVFSRLPDPRAYESRHTHCIVAVSGCPVRFLVPGTGGNVFLRCERWMGLGLNDALSAAISFSGRYNSAGIIECNVTVMATYCSAVNGYGSRREQFGVCSLCWLVWSAPYSQLLRLIPLSSFHPLIHHQQRWKFAGGGREFAAHIRALSTYLKSTLWRCFHKKCMAFVILSEEWSHFDMLSFSSWVQIILLSAYSSCS